MVATLAYLNFKFTLFVNLTVLAANIIRLIINYDPADQDTLGANVLALFVIVLVGYTSIAVTSLLRSFIKENLGELKSAA